MPCHVGGMYGHGQSGLYLSTDGGESWMRSAGFPEIYVNNIVADPVEPLVAYASTGLGILLTTDGGATWHDWNGGVVTPDHTDGGWVVPDLASAVGGGSTRNSRWLRWSTPGH